MTHPTHPFDHRAAFITCACALKFNALPGEISRQRTALGLLGMDRSALASMGLSQADIDAVAASPITQRKATSGR